MTAAQLVAIVFHLGIMLLRRLWSQKIDARAEKVSPRRQAEWIAADANLKPRSGIVNAGSCCSIRNLVGKPQIAIADLIGKRGCININARYVVLRMISIQKGRKGVGNEWHHVTVDVIGVTVKSMNVGLDLPVQTTIQFMLLERLIYGRGERRERVP